jgi:hypothetical protein
MGVGVDIAYLTYYDHYALNARYVYDMGLNTYLASSWQFLFLDELAILIICIALQFIEVGERFH